MDEQGKDGRLHRRWAVNGNAARASRVWIRAKRVWDMVVVRADHLEMVWPREMNLRKEQLLTRKVFCSSRTQRDGESEEGLDTSLSSRCQGNETVVSSVRLRSFEAVAWLEEAGVHGIL